MQLLPYLGGDNKDVKCIEYAILYCFKDEYPNTVIISNVKYAKYAKYVKYLKYAENVLFGPPLVQCKRAMLQCCSRQL